MSDVITRLKRGLSYSETKSLKVVLEAINYESGIFISSKLADKVQVTRSVVVNALCKLEIAGLVETRSLGSKGTYIKIVEKGELKNLIQEVM